MNLLIVNYNTEAEYCWAKTRMPKSFWYECTLISYCIGDIIHMVKSSAGLLNNDLTKAEYKKLVNDLIKE